MSIYKLNFNDYKQDLTTNIENKVNYGEIHTNFSLIEEMMDLIPEHYYENPDLKWLDPGCGFGYFSMILFKKLNLALKKVLPNDKIRKYHIVKKMIYMVEINPEYHSFLKLTFGEESNIISTDFLTYLPEEAFDIVIGNPPFNFNGMKKVPTNSQLKKRHDGKTIWADFIKKSISLLKPNGLLLFIVPSIWMKPDRFKIYDYIMQFKIHKIHCFSNTKMNQLFRGEAQTPSCYFLMEKKGTDKKVFLWDTDYKSYSELYLREKMPIPVFGSTIINKILPFVRKHGNLKLIKSNMPNKKIKFSKLKTDVYCYPNIKTCIIKDKILPSLSINYSNHPCCFHDKSKLVLAHGMYGFPYIDSHKFYGISNRDKYVYLDDSEENLKKIRDFLSTKFALYIYESTRYRMKYLEKYCFEYLPNIINISDFPKEINDESIADYFHLSQEDRENIQSLHKKIYKFFK